MKEDFWCISRGGGEGKGKGHHKLHGKAAQTVNQLTNAAAASVLSVFDRKAHTFLTNANKLLFGFFISVAASAASFSSFAQVVTPRKSSLLLAHQVFKWCFVLVNRGQ